MFDRIAIVAPGLLGASVAMAVHAQSIAKTVAVYARRQQAVDELSTFPWCDQASTNLSEICAEADFIVLCAPVERIISLAEELAPIVSTNPIVTDVGSVKLDITSQCQKALAEKARFVGSHPMAGSEKTGMENARADLFEDRICFVTPTGNTEPGALEKTGEFWRALGSRVMQTSPQDHDAIVAQVSHLPHILASSLASYLSKARPDAAEFCGNGLRDTTRIASGCPGLWGEIVGQNRAEILRAIAEFQSHLQTMRHAIEHADESRLQTLLQDGKTFRDSL